MVCFCLGLTALTRISVTGVNRSGKVTCSYRVADRRGKAFGLTLFGVLAVGCSSMLFSRVEGISYYFIEFL